MHFVEYIILIYKLYSIHAYIIFFLEHLLVFQWYTFMYRCIDSITLVESCYECCQVHRETYKEHMVKEKRYLHVS